MLTARFERALHLASRIHAGDVRKGKSTPYLAHLLDVTSLVIQFGGDEDSAIGALLHDAIEDHPESVSEASLAAEFGSHVAQIVSFCTDTPPSFLGGPKPPWRPRKEAFLRRLVDGDADQLIVVCADKHSNASELLSDLRHDPLFSWDRFMVGENEQRWYYNAVAETLRRSGFRNALLDEYVLQLIALDQVLATRRA